MFTGIVEERGVVRRPGSRLAVAARTVLRDSGAGASIAVNGVCLTVADRTMPDGSDEGILEFDLTSETMDRSSLGDIPEGAPVNLERPVTLLSRLGGHLVQGHVDGMGMVRVVEDRPPGRSVGIALPPELAPYVVEKGSIAVDGVSLTVARTDGRQFEVALVPYTLDATTLGSATVGDRVNLEVDVIAKYVEGLVGRAR